jgi:hypothetical protein
MSFWNYRIGRTKNSDGTYMFKVVEVYYKENRSVFGWCDASIVVSDDQSEVRGDLNLLQKAAKRRIIDLDKVNKKAEEVRKVDTIPERIAPFVPVSMDMAKKRKRK